MAFYAHKSWQKTRCHLTNQKVKESKNRVGKRVTGEVLYALEGSAEINLVGIWVGEVE